MVVQVKGTTLVEVFENQCIEYWDVRGKKQQEAEERCIMRSYVICASCQMLMRVMQLMHVARMGEKTYIYKEI